MITAYALAAFFAFGALCGMTYKDQTKPPAKEWALMVLMAACWPALAYVFWLEWRGGK